jgi:Fungal Zn(2)-Cys(6) binuclear cluster domain
MEPLPGGVPTVAGRTPIACQNCANAKTGCDKRVPCSRCAEKNLPCAARFARRSPKAAVRAQATAAYGSQMGIAPGQQPQQPQPLAYMDVDPTLPNTLSPRNSISGSPSAMLPDGPSKKNSPPHSHNSVDDFPSPRSRVEPLDDFMQLSNDFAAPDANYNDLLVWPEYPLDIDMYANSMPLARSEMPMPNFTELSDISSNSEPTTSSSSRGSIHTRGTSIMSSNEFDTALKPMEQSMGVLGDTMIPEFEVVIAAEAAWPLARCSPPIYSGTCPRTAIIHLECLEQKSKEDGTWSSLEKYLDQVDWDSSDTASVVPLTSRTRDKMLAITQSFLHKALEIHRGGLNGYPKPAYASPGDFNFIVLPPTKILEYFLRSYVRSLNYYFPLVVAGCVDPNEMLINNQASTLLVLLMIAQGAASVPMAEARYLAAGLTETCRISLFDIIEKDVELSADPVALRCALLFTILGAWSGDKWQMDISMGQRGMYLAVRHLDALIMARPWD